MSDDGIRVRVPLTCNFEDSGEVFAKGSDCRLRCDGCEKLCYVGQNMERVLGEGQCQVTCRTSRGTR